MRELSVAYPGAQVDGREFTGLQPGVDTVRVRESFAVPELGQRQAGILSLTIPWRTQLRDWSGVIVADATRRSPINLRLLNVDEEETMEVALPAGTRLAAVPEGEVLEMGACRYEVTYSRTAEGLRIGRRLVLDGDLVLPELYPAFKDFLDRVRRDMQRPLHLRVS